MEEIINKVDLSGIVTLDLINYKPLKNEYIAFDLVPYLFKGYLLKEKVFRVDMIQIDWSRFTAKEVILYCSNDAIVPYWAYVFITSLLKPYTERISYADLQDHEEKIWMERIKRIDYKVFNDKKVVLKASTIIPPQLYVCASGYLMDHVQSLMWGEAGSPIMIYKKKKKLIKLQQ
ncbi:hypothetical protein TH53_10790 [Pedobacter lusitanus]|uniref:DUF2480 family protein n=1 Tax=Pedobacter lusitanus TaxID=1503925 RepID=A0A0D0FXF4_9SPHI|nr:DUF2480 family protein [Pedobacter lusitanus]KIO77194.1 hypothetical protein TH53_10790 [Pedobacter lusitanus]